MTNLKSAYEDEDHFTCKRVLEFLQRYKRACVRPDECVPAVIVDDYVPSGHDGRPAARPA